MKLFAALSYPLSLLLGPVPGLVLLIAAKERWAQRHAVKSLMLFVAEVFVPSFGVLTIGGIVCLTLGGVMLVDTPAGFMRLSLDVVASNGLA